MQFLNFGNLKNLDLLPRGELSPELRRLWHTCVTVAAERAYDSTPGKWYSGIPPAKDGWRILAPNTILLDRMVRDDVGPFPSFVMANVVKKWNRPKIEKKFMKLYKSANNFQRQ